MLDQTLSIFTSRPKIQSHHFLIHNFIQEIKSLTHRLFIQAIRRPASVISGLIQPLLWLILFGALFQNVPLQLFHENYNYSQFLSCGILIFTCFTGSLNAGLPLVFDREFGFLNRLLVTPLTSRNTIILASIIFIVCITMLQNIVMLTCSLKSFHSYLNFHKLQIIIIINTLITIIISSLSLSLAFILPGHIEFIAFVFIINLPTLFASTALAPLYLMPYWLQMIAKFNILTYGIETLRFITKNNSYDTSIIQILNIHLKLQNIFILFIFLTFLSLIAMTHLVQQRLK